MIGEYDSSAMMQRRYVMGPGSDEPLVEYDKSGASFTRVWLHADERGSIVAESNDSGTTTAIDSYDEYGVPASGNTGRFDYTGQAWLPSLGIWYYKARMYAPRLGRFMQTDPIGYSDGPNWYNYVGGDPINAFDSLGLEGDVTVNGSFGCYGDEQHVKNIGCISFTKYFSLRSPSEPGSDTGGGPDVVATAPVNCGLHPTDSRCVVTRTIPFTNIKINACLYAVGKAALESTPLGLVGGTITSVVENQIDHPSAAGTVEFLDEAGNLVRKSLSGPNRLQTLVNGAKIGLRANAIGLAVGAVLAGGWAYFTSDECK